MRAIFGDSRDALRLTCLAAVAASIVLVALMARELGGGRLAQTAAAALWAFSPYALGGASIFHPTWLDLLAWVALLYVVLLVLTRAQPRLWLVAGIVAGLGLEAKYTIVVLFAGILVGLLATPSRRLLLTPELWVGCGIAVLLFLPNVVWQAEHGWPSVHFFASQNATTADDTPPATYVAQQLFLGVGVVAAIVGVVWMWRRAALRPLALVPPVVTLLFFLERGRAYYPLPADSIAIAAGAVALVAWRADGTIVAENYGEASALEFYGPARGLPRILSGHLSWQYWRLRRLPQRFVLFVGFDRSELSGLCRGGKTVARIDNRRHLDNEERGRVLVACPLRQPLGAIWQSRIARDEL